MELELLRKISNAKYLIEVALEKCAKEGKRLEVAYSGGKDSDVLLWLAREVCGDSDILRPCYKNTTIDPPFTMAHVLSKNVEVLKPRMSFGEIIQQKGFPSRFRRFCCEILKEYKVEDNALIGVRRAESTKRKLFYKEPEICRVFSKKERVHQYYPLLDFSNQDIKDVVEQNDIQCHPLYYDGEGLFHVERRLGCLCCPLMSLKQRIEQFRKYPRMVHYYLRNGDIFLKRHPNSKTALINNDVYEMFYHHLSKNDDNTLFSINNYKDFIINYFYL